MTVYRYQEISARGYKRGRCPVCGKTAERQQTFTNTVNPFNMNDDGTVRTSAEVWQRVSRLAREWEQEPCRPREVRVVRDPKFDAPEVSPHRPYLSELCNECGNEVWDDEDDAGPSCGAHVLHIDCGPWFGCTYCYEIRAEIP